MRILIAEDETELAKGLKFLLEKERFNVDIVHDGEDALAYFDSTEYDVVVLDIMMPKKNGLEVLKSIRKSGSSVPIMLLTAKAEIEDRVIGLESGADDYLPKPFATKEFIARVKALSRRNQGYNSEKMQVGDVVLDCNSYELVCGEKSVQLNNKEYQLAELFFKNPKHIFSTEQLMDIVWGLESNAEINVVWTTLGFIRKKIKELGASVEIKTIRGAGYALEDKK